MTVEEKRQWWNEMDNSWKRHFKIEINPIFHSDREGRERFIPDDGDLDNLLETEFITIYNSAIKDFKSLAPMEKLHGIHCNAMPFLTTLEELPLVQQLDSFRLTSSKVTSFVPLGKMKNISSLELLDNPVKNLNGLEKLSSLKELSLSEKEISDLIPLGNLSALEKLNLADMRIADFSPLQTIKSLKRLTIERMAVSSFDFLKDMQNLENLFCEQVTIDAIEGLSALSCVKVLTLNNCHIQNLAPVFSSLTELSSLSLIGTKIDSLEALASNKNLAELYITEDHFTLEAMVEFRKNHPACAVYSEMGKNFPFSKYEIYEVLQELEMKDSRDNIKVGAKVKFTSYTYNHYDGIDMFYFSELGSVYSFLWTKNQYEEKRVNDFFRKL